MAPQDQIQQLSDQLATLTRINEMQAQALREATAMALKYADKYADQLMGTSTPQPLFRNRKNGNLYRVAGHGIDATNCRSGLPVVIYHLDGYPLELIARAHGEFAEKFERVSE